MGARGDAGLIWGRGREIPCGLTPSLSLLSRQDSCQVPDDSIYVFDSLIQLIEFSVLPPNV